MSQISSNFKNGAIALIILLLALSGYQWYSNNQLKSQLSQQKQELSDLQIVQAELDQDYQDALEKLENLRDDNKELNNLIDNQKKDLAAQKKKINDLIWSKRELGKAREEIAKLSSMTDQYVTEIKTLKDENARLYSENLSLSEEKQLLSVSLQEERKAKQELAQVKAVLAVQNEELTIERKKLSSLVDMGSAIKINFLQVQGYELKDDGKLKKKGKAKDVDVLRICFRTETNMVTPASSETFLVRYIDPNGETIAVEDLGSGVVMDKLSNTEVRYSTSGAVDYQQEDTNACIDWQLNYQIPKGVYGVEMYNKGFMVGKGSFKLK